MGIVRKTKSVKKILAFMENSEDAVSAPDLIDVLRQDMNKTTVYRVLERLESDGIIHSFTGKNGAMMYAKCTDCSSEKHSDVHPHFHCTECGKAECLPVDVSVPNIANYQIESINLLLVGRCDSCLL